MGTFKAWKNLVGINRCNIFKWGKGWTNESNESHEYIVLGFMFILFGSCQSKIPTVESKMLDYKVIAKPLELFQATIYKSSWILFILHHEISHNHNESRNKGYEH